MVTEITYVNTVERCAIDVLTVGEPIICLDTGGTRLDEATDLHVSLGGAECNVAIGLARLGHRTAIIGRVGSDPFGRFVRRRLLAEQVDVSRLAVDDVAPTALLFKETTYLGAEVHYRRAGAAGAQISATEVSEAMSDGVRCVHVTGVTAALGAGPRDAVASLMEQGRSAGARVSFDANFRHKLATPDELVAMFHLLCPMADDLLLGWGEASLLAGDSSEESIRSLAESLQRPCVVVKRPAGGALCLASGEWYAHDAEPVHVVDPVGAGDGFAVGFLHERLRGSNVRAALARGVSIAARVIAVRGDNAGLPYEAELDDVGVGVVR